MVVCVRKSARQEEMFRSWGELSPGLMMNDWRIWRPRKLGSPCLLLLSTGYLVLVQPALPCHALLSPIELVWLGMDTMMMSQLAVTVRRLFSSRGRAGASVDQAFHFSLQESSHITEYETKTTLAFVSIYCINVAS